jgi:hypothetical protein
MTAWPYRSVLHPRVFAESLDTRETVTPFSSPAPVAVMKLERIKANRKSTALTVASASREQFFTAFLHRFWRSANLSIVIAEFIKEPFNPVLR